MPSAGSSPPNPERIRTQAAEILARDDYDLTVRGHEGTWFVDLLMKLLEWLLIPFRWVFQMTEGLPEVFRWLIILAMIVLLGLLVWHMLASIIRAVRGETGRLQAVKAARRRAVDPEELEQEADAAGRQGDYVTAVRRLFRAAVLRLERSDKRPLRPGTTNRALLRRYGDRPTVGQALGLFVETIDRKWYGNEPCLEADYAACRLAHRDVCLGIEGGTHVQRP